MLLGVAAVEALSPPSGSSPPSGTLFGELFGEQNIDLKDAKVVFVEEYFNPDDSPFFVIHLKLPDGRIVPKLYDPARAAKVKAYDKMVDTTFN